MFLKILKKKNPDSVGTRIYPTQYPSPYRKKNNMNS